MEFFANFFIIAFGCLGHFIFEWSGHKHIAGLFFAVNESTWEHIKLAIYPSLLWFIAEAAFHGMSCALVTAQAASLVSTMLLIPLLFYGYTAITGQNWLITDILCFILSVIGGRRIFTLILEAQPSSALLTAISTAAIVAVTVMYLTFSYRPPRNFLFRDPISGEFGPHGHGCHTHYHKL